MQEALRLAAAGEGYVEPNPMVGAVIVSGDRVSGRGFHRRFGGPHAEVDAIKNAKQNGADTRGADLYVTLEPCAHRGKTPPCTGAVIEAGLKKVFIAARDPMWKEHSDAADRHGRGLDALEAAGIETEIGPCHDAALMLNAAFYKRAATGMPLVLAKWAMSADGKIASRTGSSRWISCPQSRRTVHRIRGKVDAIVIGRTTAGRDDPHLTCREAEKCRTARRVVLCGETSLKADTNLVRTAKETPLTLAFTGGKPPPGIRELQRLGCELMPLPQLEKQGPARVDPKALLHALAELGAANVLIEGGGSVLGCFFDAGLVDRVLIYMAPFIIGGGAAVTPVAGKGVDNIKAAFPLKGPLIIRESPAPPDEPRTEVRAVGKDVMLSGWLSDPRQWGA